MWSVMTYLNADLFAWGLGVALVLAGIAVLVWAMFGDRVKYRRRCPKCWYDMTGTPGMTCGECGFTPRHESHFYRRRRRWRLVPLAMILFIPHTWYTLQWQYGERWWLGAIPTSWLVVFLPFVNDLDNDLYKEMQRRFGAGEVDAGHWEALLERCIEGDGRATPGSEQWRQKYGRMISTWRSKLVEDPDLSRRALDLPPHVRIGRGVVEGTAGGPVCAPLRMTTWWPAGTDARLRITPRINGRAVSTEPIVLMRTPDSERPRAYPLLLSEVPDDATRLTLHIETERRNEKLGIEWESLDTVVVSADIPEARPVEETIAAVSVPDIVTALDEAVRRAVAGRVQRWGAGERRVTSFRFDRALFTQTFNDTALGVHVEILRDGVVKHTLSIWGPIGASVRRQRFRWLYSPDGNSFVDDMNRDGAAWMVRVRSDPDLATLVPGATKYWEGEYTVPLVVEEVEGPGWREEWTVVPNTASPTTGYGDH